MIKLHLPANSRVTVDGIRYITCGDYWTTGKSRIECVNAIRHRIAKHELIPGTWWDIVLDSEDIEEVAV